MKLNDLYTMPAISAYVRVQCQVSVNRSTGMIMLMYVVVPSQS
jgi:hypothetical protein